VQCGQPVETIGHRIEEVNWPKLKTDKESRVKGTNGDEVSAMADSPA
jgi:hypothetical protein